MPCPQFKPHHSSLQGVNKEGSNGCLEDSLSWLSEFFLAEKTAVNKCLEEHQRTLLTKIETWIEHRNSEDRCKMSVPSPQPAHSLKACTQAADPAPAVVQSQHKNLKEMNPALAPPTTDSLPPLLTVSQSYEFDDVGNTPRRALSSGTSHNDDMLDSKSSRRKVIKLFMDMPSERSRAKRNDSAATFLKRKKTTESMGSAKSRQGKLLRVFTRAGSGIDLDDDACEELGGENTVGSSPAQKERPIDSMIEEWHAVAGSLSMTRDERELMKLKGLRWFVQSNRFEIMMAIIIAVNAVVMAAKVQYIGAERGFKMGIQQAYKTQDDQIDEIFKLLELVIGCMFVFEVVLKLIALNCRFWFSLWNLFDFVVVSVWVLDTWDLIHLGLNPMVLRLASLLKLIKMAKLTRAFRLFDSLQLLVGAIKASVSVLVWASAVLLLVQILWALLMSQVLETYISDASVEEARRVQVWKYFGTFGRSLLTLFEITLGNWIVPCRLLLDNVAGWYGVAFVSYKLSIGFAVVNVISAVFIQQTIKVAAADENIMIAQKAKESRRHQAELRHVFQDLDLSQDGVVSLDEFQFALKNERVKHLLAALEINIIEAFDVFELLNNGDNEISWDEFLVGMRRIKGPAQAVDMVRLLFDQKRDAQAQQERMEEQMQVLIRLETRQSEMHDMISSVRLQKSNTW